jgi:hypothetical protein
VRAPDQGRGHDMVHSGRFPLTARCYERDDLFDADTDVCFGCGLTLILAGMRAINQS